MSIVPLTAYDWMLTAERHLRDARVLRERGGSSEGVFWFCGLSVECALKAVIMKRERWNQWPSFEREPKLHKHNLRLLLKRAGLQPVIAVERLAASNLAANWDTVKSWRSERPRYPGERMPQRVANDVFRAVNHREDGVLIWLQNVFQSI